MRGSGRLVVAQLEFQEQGRDPGDVHAFIRHGVGRFPVDHRSALFIHELRPEPGPDL